MAETVQEFLERRGIQTLVRVVEARDRHEGARQFAESYGLGSIVPNTVVMGTSADEERFAGYAELVASLHQARRNVVIYSEGDGRGHGERRRIDVWWGGLHRNGGLMMVLAYLLRTGVRWHYSSIHVKLVVDREEAKEPALANLRRIVEELRIGAVPEVTVADGRPFPEILAESSGGADLVFLGLAEPGDEYAAYLWNAQRRTETMPPTAYVLAAENVPFGEVLIDQSGERAS